MRPILAAAICLGLPASAGAQGFLERAQCSLTCAAETESREGPDFDACMARVCGPEGAGVAATPSEPARTMQEEETVVAPAEPAPQPAPVEMAPQPAPPVQQAPQPAIDPAEIEALRAEIEALRGQVETSEAEAAAPPVQKTPPPAQATKPDAKPRATPDHPAPGRASAKRWVNARAPTGERVAGIDETGRVGEAGLWFACVPGGRSVLMLVGEPRGGRYRIRIGSYEKDRRFPIGPSGWPEFNIRDGGAVMKRLIAGERVQILRGNGRELFDLPLDGSAQALSRARSGC